MVGQPLRILNSDRLLHNVHMMPKVNEEFNKAMPARHQEAAGAGHDVSQPEVMVPFKCDVHPWMKAYIGVPAASLLRRECGRRQLRHRERTPGKYTLKAWHEFFADQVQEIEVADGAVTVNFGLKPPSKKK